MLVGNSLHSCHHSLSLQAAHVFALRLEYSGRDVAHTLCFISITILAQTGANLKPDIMWLVRIVPQYPKQQLLHISRALQQLQCYQRWSQHPWEQEKKFSFGFV